MACCWMAEVLLKTMGIEAVEKGLREVHIIKAVNSFIPVILNDTFGLHLTGANVSGLGILTWQI